MKTTEDYDWSSFDVHMPVPCDADEAYDCWATSEGMERFFVQRFAYLAPDGSPRGPDERARAGDSYGMAFHHPAQLEGKVLLSEPGKQFAFTFGDMRVTVTFETLEDRTLVRLVQSEIPLDDLGKAHSHLNCRSCWVYYLMNLRSVIEHGVDLRDAGLPDNPVGIEFGQRMKEKGS